VKRVASIGPGSSVRNHRVQVELLGQAITIERIGTDGNLDRAASLLRELDGKVDAFGLANIDLALTAGGRTYPIRDAVRLIQGVTRTPVVDGAGLKSSWEPWLVSDYLGRHGLDLRGKRVLLVSAMDRYPLAEALVRLEADVVFGDFMFAAGLPIPLRSLRAVRSLARVVLPVATRLPFRWLYPVGSQQTEIRPRHERFNGDFHYIRRYLPSDLSGKTVLTQTTTAQDVDELRARRLEFLVTDFAPIDGRSFATNVMQAVVVALLERPPDEIQPEEYVETLLEAGIRPRIERLGEPS
jgi:hypothetical protein